MPSVGPRWHSLSSGKSRVELSTFAMTRGSDVPQDDVLRSLLDRLVAAYHPERTCLFGSRARGEAGPPGGHGPGVT